MGNWLDPVQRKLKKAKLMLTASKADLHRQAPEQDSHRDYQKFIILAHHRSGSSMINQGMNMHSEISSFGEIFIHSTLKYNVPGFTEDLETIRYLRNQYPSKWMAWWNLAPQNQVALV